MVRSILKLESVGGSGKRYRTVFKNQHGRSIYLELLVEGESCQVADCFYTDRNRGKEGAARFSAKPKLLRTLKFDFNDLITVISNELDKRFYGVELVHSADDKLPTEEYLKLKTAPSKMKLLIMAGGGQCVNGIPVLLRTKLKSNLHRSVFIELSYYKDGLGVVNECCYCDRQYRHRETKVTPPTLVSCFFPYTRQGILNLINSEICCDFTHIIVTSDIDVNPDTDALCGAL